MFYTPNYGFLNQLSSILQLKVNDYLEIGIIVLILYYVIKNLKGTRAWTIAKGCLIVLILYELSFIMSFKVLTYIANGAITFLIMALVIMFQPELRKILETLGRKNFSIKSIFENMKIKKNSQSLYSKESIDALVKSINIMSKAKTGALILIERESSLSVYESSGIPLNATITSQLIVNAFEKNTPLHDGAMIIRNNQITAATCYLPLSDNRNINKDLGTRHRAAIGASEETDALVLVVSEETGAISIVEQGEIKHNVSIESLREILVDNQLKTKMFNSAPKDKNKNFKFFIISLVLGLLTWVFLTTLVDPIVTVNFSNIPVKIINETQLTDDGYVYEIVKGDTINIDVTGKKSIVNAMTTSNFSAVADASEVSISNSMNIKVTANRNGSDLDIDTHNAMITVSIEEATSVDCPIVAEAFGETEDGFYVAELTPNVKTITITGAASKLKTVDKAVAMVDISNHIINFETSSTLIIYDKNGEKFDLTNCTLSNDNVKITSTVYSTKSVPINITAYDSSYDDCIVNTSDIKTERETILIAASDELLSEIEVIQIDLDMASIHGEKASITIDPANYLPNGVYYAESDHEFSVSMNIKRTATRTVAISSKDISQKNGASSIFDDVYNIKVKCNTEFSYDEIIKGLKPFINLNNLDSGEHQIPLEFEIDKTKIEVVEGTKVHLTIEEN